MYTFIHRLFNTVLGLLITFAFMIPQGDNVLAITPQIIASSQESKDILPAADWEQIKSILPNIVPNSQQAYIKSSNPGLEDKFGFSVDISGDTVVVGAPYEDSDATGSNGDQNNEWATNSGAVYIFVRMGNTWIQQAYIKASNPGNEDNFGYSVAIDGDTLVVGAPWEESNATGINGNQTDNSVHQAGAAYIFVRTGTTWSQQGYLKASNTRVNNNFGFSVDISGSTVVVGSYGESSNATGVNSIPIDNWSRPNSGAVYVFTRSGSVWSQNAFIKASNNGSYDDFGYSVSIFNDTLAVGARKEDSNATGVDGDEDNDTGIWSGAVYVFTRSGNDWLQESYIKASNTDTYDQFGAAVSVYEDTLAVGALFEDSIATGVNSNQTNDSAGDSGAVYLFTRTSGSWNQQAYIKASNTEQTDWFGLSVAISGDTLVVSAINESSNAIGTNGDQTDDSLLFSGATYLFTRAGSTWLQDSYIKASNPNVYDKFGYSVSISDNTLVSSAINESSNATGVNGDQENNSIEAAGAVYVFSSPPIFTDVPYSYWANSYIERLYTAGITGGCGTGIYCPDNSVTRAQMAIFLLKGIHGSSYAPPAVGVSTGFGDVATDYWAAAWIKQLAAEGITGGCGGGNYCPDNVVTRAQMAVFLLKAKNGSSYSPPAVGVSTGFNDVATDAFAAAFIKQLVAEGITAGCGNSNYCPDDSVTRAQMAVFLVRAFNLP